MKRWKYLAAGIPFLLLMPLQCSSLQPDQAGRAANGEKAKSGSPAEQMPPGAGRGIFVYDFSKAPARRK